MLENIIDWVRKFANSDIGQLLGFISLISWGYGVIKFYYKKAKGNLNTIKGISLIIFIISLGLVIPVIILIFSDWSTVIKIILNCLAIFCLFSFVFLLYIIKAMNSVTKDSATRQQMEEVKIMLRGTHAFFNGDLNIYLTDQDFFGYPPGHKVTARIWSPNYDEVSIKRKSVGYSLIYSSNSNYRIRITRAEINEATFQVIKM